MATLINQTAAKRIFLAFPRGFCAGVDRAIEVVEKSLSFFGTPLYVRHEIVHNKFIVNDFRQKGVVFVDDITSVPPGQTVIFSAHGVSPEIRTQADRLGLQTIDATCPLVTKVHNEARKFAALGYTILLIGHKKHVETEGTFGEAPEQTIIIENDADAKQINIPDSKKVAYLTQTTLSIDDTREIIETIRHRFPQIQEPAKSDICYATTNRQEAVKVLAQKCDLILVIGSPNSSNSNRLKEIALAQRTQAYLIDDETQINPQWLLGCYNVGITAGASAPELLVKGVLQYLKNLGYSQEEHIILKEEKVTFHLPDNIRHLETPKKIK